MVWLQILILVFFSFLLIKATDILITSIKALARTTGLGQLAITSIVLALATSLPELFVGVTAALEGAPGLALGNILGSNIADLSLVIGGAALLGGTLVVKGEVIERDILYTFLIGVLPLLLLLDNNLTRLDGVILVLVYFWYSTTVSRFKRKEMGENGDIWVRRLIRKLKLKSGRRQLGWFFLGVALLIFSADVIVRMAMGIAASLKIPVFWAGLFLVAVGTSFPELSFELAAIRKHQASMAMGDLLGSVVANSTLILGMVSIISPIRLTSLFTYLLATMFFLAIFAFFYVLVRTKRKLERWEAGILILLYVLFLVAELLRA